LTEAEDFAGTFVTGCNVVGSGNVWVFGGREWGRVKPGSPGYYLPTAVSDGHGGWWSQPYADSALTRYLLHRVGGRWLRSALPIALVDPIGGLPYYEIIRVPHSDTMLVAGSPLSGPEGVVLALGRL
jgi:hypothetical protein